MQHNERSVVLTTAAAALFLAGCSVMPGNQAPKAISDKDIGDAHVTSVVIQDAIYTRSLGKKQEGLFSALKSQIAPGEPQAEATVAPVRDALAGVDFRGELAKELEDYFEKGLRFTTGAVEARSRPIVSAADRLARMAENGLLLLETEYFFTPDYRAMRIETKASLYLKPTAGDSKKAKQEPKPVYSNEIIVHSEIVAGKKEDALDHWVANNGTAAIDTLRQGIKETARLLVWDINDRNQAKTRAKPQTWTVVNADSPGTQQVKGVLILETTKRNIVRLNNGQLLSMPNPKNEKPATAVTSAQ